MSAKLARILYENGRWHALAGQLIQKGAIEYAESEGLADLNQFVHNGPYSLALFQSIGLGLELMLKAALVYSASIDEDTLKREYGHNLERVLDDLDAAGFSIENDAALRELVKIVSPSYRAQIFRYGRPDGVELPNDMDQVFGVFSELDIHIVEMLNGE